MAASRIRELAAACLSGLRQTVAVFRNVVVRDQESPDLSDGQNQSEHGNSRCRRAVQSEWHEHCDGHIWNMFTSHLRVIRSQHGEVVVQLTRPPTRRRTLKGY